MASAADGDEALIWEIKDRQRQSENTRQAWKSYCELEGGGVRDPKRHCSAFLRAFLHALDRGEIPMVTAPLALELVEVTSNELALRDRQITLKMPSSEVGILKEVVTTNVYGFLPGRACVLRTGDVVLDVGAHVGIAATLSLLTEEVRVVCIEPHPVTFGILQHNMEMYHERAMLLNVGVADSAGSRQLFVHAGTSAPSRLYFSSLFDTRPHNDESMTIPCVPLQDLVGTHRPTVIKIDAEGAERFLESITDFGRVRLISAEWDWTHNRNQSMWKSTEAHLQRHGFKIVVRSSMPEFNEAGDAILHSPNGKKRGNTGMIFNASRECGKATAVGSRAEASRDVPNSPPETRPLWSDDDGVIGCPVGALICATQNLSMLFEACKPSALVQPKGAVPLGNGRTAVHLNLEGAALLTAGQVPPRVQELLDSGLAEFAPGFRRGAASQAYRGHITPSAAAVETSAPLATFRFIDLFAGIGGFRRGLEAVGGRCVFTSEVDRDCQDTYALNFGSDNIFGDITSIESSEFPEHDILTAGFPCQPFSRRGGQGGFSDGRGGLFLEIPRVLHSRRPAGFLLENVWNLLYIDGGHRDKDEAKCKYGYAFKRVLDCLQRAGYVVQAKVLNARGWVPQERERVYIVGFRYDLAEQAQVRFKWPEPPEGGVLGDILEPARSEDAQACELTEKQWDAVQRSSSWSSGGADIRFADPSGFATTLTSSYKGSFPNLAQLVPPGQHGSERPRFFTRRECARIMGFAETQHLGNPNCPNRAYHQLGNAVCPPLIEAIARNLVHSLNLTDQGREVRPAGSGAGECPRSSDFCSHGQYLETTGAQPELREQLEALTVEQMSSRLESWGMQVRQPLSYEFVRGFKAARKEELLDILCTEYAARAAAQPRQVVEDVGVPVATDAALDLLHALRMMDWKENIRPAVHSSGYCVLKRPPELALQPRWRESDPRVVRKRIWELAQAILQNASQKAAHFHFTAIAISKNFRGSPHVDKNDITHQYALSLGEFEEGGGKLCVEESPFVIRAIDTRGRLACIDGRFPHWVSGYAGERYSVIFYCSSGDEEPCVQAVHAV